MINYPYPSLAKFTAFVQLKDFRGPTKKEYVRYVRRLGDHYQCDPATLTEDQVRAYYLELRQVRRFGASAMKVAKCALRAFFQDCLQITGWTVFGELRIAPPQTLARVLAREEVATLLQAVELPRYRAVLGLISLTPACGWAKPCAWKGATCATRTRNIRACMCAAGRAARTGLCRSRRRC